jgi:hypothetical protein
MECREPATSFAPLEFSSALVAAWRGGEMLTARPVPLDPACPEDLNSASVRSL